MSSQHNCGRTQGRKLGATSPESASEAPDGVAVGPGSGCTLRSINKKLKEFFKRKGMRNENWKSISDSKKRGMIEPRKSAKITKGDLSPEV